MINRDLLLENAQIVGQKGVNQILIAAGRIQAIAPKLDSESNPNKVDLQGDWLSLGGVDLQINGGLGLAFPDLGSTDLPKLRQICDFLWQQGVDCFLPTIVTTAVAKT
ncbi:MAG: N-acetylglucosamine-6-phosphate deacetylase, partial [Cyanobacteria bacterium P01_A01_bin.40]